jgi:4-amino-4-deoxy-L-arabinose transferase-like glycosyltransferase
MRFDLDRLRGGKTTEEGKSNRSFWTLITAIPFIVIIVAAIRWSLDHPYGIYWDESIYFNEAAIDLQHLRSWMLVKLAGGILKAWARPPAYRLFALPFLALFGFHTVIPRLVTLACYSMSCWTIYLATRRIGSRVAGVFAVLFFSLCTEVVVSSTYFSTEGPLLLATAGMLYFLVAYWSEKAPYKGNWIGLGLAVGLGFLSKTSFALMAFPLLAFFSFNAYRKGPDRRDASILVKAGAVAFLVAGPWWLLNFRSALSYASYARNQHRGSLGPPSFATWVQWVGTVGVGLLGPSISILVVLVAIVSVQKFILSRRAILDPVQRTALLGCASAALPLVAAQLLGANHLLRYLVPTLIPLAIAIAVLSDQSGWIHSRAAIVISAVLFLIQLVMIMVPVLFTNQRPVDPGLVNGALPWRILVRFDQWDWRLVRDIGRGCNIETPRIAYLGNGRAFNQPQVEYPWVMGGARLPEVTWLWRYEDGPLNWQKVWTAVENSDIVLTAPYYIGQLTDKQDLDNQHNADFADRLFRDPRFRAPIRVEMGRFVPVEIEVFLKKTLVCQQEISASQ